MSQLPLSQFLQVLGTGMFLGWVLHWFFAKTTLRGDAREKRVERSAFMIGQRYENRFIKGSSVDAAISAAKAKQHKDMA